MKEPVQVVVASRKRDKLLVILGYLLLFGGFWIMFYYLSIGIVVSILGFVLYCVGRFLDWWNRGLLGDERFK